MERDGYVCSLSQPLSVYLSSLYGKRWVCLFTFPPPHATHSLWGLSHLFVLHNYLLKTTLSVFHNFFFAIIQQFESLTMSCGRGKSTLTNKPTYGRYAAKWIAVCVAPFFRLRVSLSSSQLTVPSAEIQKSNGGWMKLSECTTTRLKETLIWVLNLLAGKVIIIVWFYTCNTIFLFIYSSHPLILLNSNSTSCM